MEPIATVWVYTGDLDNFLNGDSFGYLYPLEQRYQTQLTIPIGKLLIDSEEENTCKINRRY